MAKKKGSRTALSAFLGVIVFLAAAAGGYYLILNSFHKPPEKKPIRVKPPVVTLVSEAKKVVLYLPKEDGTEGFYLAPETRTIQAKGSILDAAVSALLATNKEAGLLASLIPAGTKLLGPVKVDRGVAVVDLSEEFVNNFSGGSDQEALTLNSLVNTVVDNSEGRARRVRFLVGGKAAESLGGHFDLTGPISPDRAWLKP